MLDFVSHQPEVENRLQTPTWRGSAVSTKNDDVIDTLNDLIETCKDGEEGFQAAARRVGSDGDSDLRALLDIYALQRAGFRAELQNEVLRRGGEPENSGHVSASLRRGWLEARSLAAGTDYAAPERDSEVLADCESGEKAALENYADALKKNLPHDLMEIVENQFEQIRLAHERFQLLGKALR